MTARIKPFGGWQTELPGGRIHVEFEALRAAVKSFSRRPDDCGAYDEVSSRGLNVSSGRDSMHWKSGLQFLMFSARKIEPCEISKSRISSAERH